MNAITDDTGMIEKEVDPRITYPCYKSFDNFIDLERLKSLDDYLTEKITERINAELDYWFLNTFRLDAETPEMPGQSVIFLSESIRPFYYYDLDKPELWKRTAAADDFPLLMDFIETLPFKEPARMILIYDNVPRPVPAHRDHLETEVCNDFIWFRTNLKKPFYVLNQKTGEKAYVESYSAWFDTVNQFHGADPCEGLSFSIRVDGQFTDEFRSRIPKPAINPASTPAFWACT
ncbi:MAG: hypothetical protein M3384_04470 [Acidobacteriota bacterium]|nr:hypothetical protein [Acidobacteriota bacterium]